MKLAPWHTLASSLALIAVLATPSYAAPPDGLDATNSAKPAGPQ